MRQQRIRWQVSMATRFVFIWEYITGGDIRENRTTIVWAIWSPQLVSPVAAETTNIIMKGPDSAITFGSAKMLAFWPIGNVGKAVNFILHFTAHVRETKVYAEAVWKQRFLGTKYCHLAVRGVRTRCFGDVALLEKEAASPASCSLLEHPMVAERVLNTVILAFHLVLEVKLQVHYVGCWIKGTEVSIVEHFGAPGAADFQTGSKTHRCNHKKDEHC